MIKIVALGVLAALVCLPAQAQQAQAGRIDLIEGSVAITDAKARPRKLAIGEPVQQGDTISTGKDGELHLKMEDGGMLAVRPDATLTIVSFQNRGKEADSSIISLARGALRAITGWIGRRSPDRVLIQTPTATIGIRGTDHETFVIPPGSQQGEPGTYDKVNAGGTRLRSDRGSVDVTPGQAAFAAAGAAPVVLPSVPAFFQPTRNERRLEGLNDSIQRSSAPQGISGGGGRNMGVQSPGQGKGQGKGGTQIQGNTRINAVGVNTNAVAVGQDNQAGNEIGTIGR